MNTNRPRRVGEKSIQVLLKSQQGKANSSLRVKTKPYQAIFAFLCVPIVVVVVLLVKSFSCSPKVAKQFLYRSKNKHGVKILCSIKTNIDNFWNARCVISNERTAWRNGDYEVRKYFSHNPWSHPIPPNLSAIIHDPIPWIHNFSLVLNSPNTT